MAQVVINKLTKSFGDVAVVKGFSLEIENGEFVALVGPSGCGKSTMLKLLAGLEDPDSGTVTIGERDVTYAAPGDRDIAMVFQSYALYPHLTVQKNMEFGLRMQGVSKETRAKQVKDIAVILGITPLLNRRPLELSGGQRQRVALGRAMVRQPQVFLMDEPLSNLDAKLRVHMRAEITTMHRRVGVTTIYVTHDQTEAMTMADRIVVLHGGTVQQIATPQEMFDNPVNLFVAGFIGTPSMNFLRAPIKRSGDGATINVLGRDISYEYVEFAADNAVSDEVIVGIRPEHFLAPQNGLTEIEITPSLIERLGSEKLIHFPNNNTAAGAVTDDNDLIIDNLVAKIPNQIDVSEGKTLKLGLSPDQILLFDPVSHARIRLRGGR